MVRQVPTTDSKYYRILFSNSDNDNDETAITRKSDRLVYNLTSGTTNSGIFLTDGTYFSKYSDIDVSQSNNGISSNASKYIANLKDKNGQTFAGYASKIGSTGEIIATIFSRSFNSSAQYTENEFSIGVRKDGTRYYQVSDGGAFRSAIGLKSGSLSNSKETTVNPGSNGTVSVGIPILLSSGTWYVYANLKAEGNTNGVRQGITITFTDSSSAPSPGTFNASCYQLLYSPYTTANLYYNVSCIVTTSSSTYAHLMLFDGNVNRHVFGVIRAAMIGVTV